MIARSCGLAEWLVDGVHCLKVAPTAEGLAAGLPRPARPPGRRRGDRPPRRRGDLPRLPRRRPRARGSRPSCTTPPPRPPPAPTRRPPRSSGWPGSPRGWRRPWWPTRPDDRSTRTRIKTQTPGAPTVRDFAFYNAGLDAPAARRPLAPGPPPPPPAPPADLLPPGGDLPRLPGAARRSRPPPGRAVDAAPGPGRPPGRPRRLRLGPGRSRPPPGRDRGPALRRRPRADGRRPPPRRRRPDVAGPARRGGGPAGDGRASRDGR